MMAGLQARRSPVVNKVKQLGNLGQVDGERGRLLNDSKVQATMLTIHFVHMIDYVLYAAGAELSKLGAIVKTQRNMVQLKQADGSLSNDKRDTPDQIMVHGHLQRGGPSFKAEPGLRWSIYGGKGEIEITTAGCFLQIGYNDMKIKLHDHQVDTVQTIDWAVNGSDEFESLPLSVRNVARLYEAYADGRHDEYAD